jgi:hypothetical protein
MASINVELIKEMFLFVCLFSIVNMNYVEWTYVILVKGLWIFIYFISYALFDLSKCYTCSKRMIYIENLNYKAYEEIMDVHSY